MASPRAFTTVIDPPTDTDGSPLALSNGDVISLDVENTDYLTAGAVLLLYPPGLKESTPVTRARQLIILSINTGGVSGKTITCTVVDVPNGRTIGFGDVVDGYTSAPFGTIRNVDGVAFPRTRAGIALAVALGKGEVYVTPGTDIAWDTSAVVYTGDDLTIRFHPSVKHSLPAGSTVQSMINIHGAGGVGGGTKVFTSNAIEGQAYAQIGSAAVTALQGLGLADGSLVYLQQDLTDAGDPGSDKFCARVTSIDQPGGAIYLSKAFPKAYTTAKNAFLGMLQTAKRNKVMGLRADGVLNSASEADAIIHYYTEDFEVEDCWGYDLPGAVVYAADLHYGSSYTGVKALRCGSSTGIFGVESISGTAASFQRIRADDCLWGIEIKAAVASNGNDLMVDFSSNRGVKFHHCQKNNFSNINSNNANTFSCITVSGDSYRNNFTNLQANGSVSEEGILMTQVPGGTNVARHNNFNGIVAVGNAGFGIYTTAALSNYNTFDNYEVDSISNNGTGNVFKKHLGLTNITTAGAATYTAAQLLTGLITRDPNGAGRTDVTDTAANLITGLNLNSDNEFFTCRLVNTADAAEAITLSAGANVTIVNPLQLVDQNESAILIIKRTSSTTVSVYILGA